MLSYRAVICLATPAPCPRGSANASSPSFLHNFTAKHSGDSSRRRRRTRKTTRVIRRVKDIPRTIGHDTLLVSALSDHSHEEEVVIHNSCIKSNKCDQKIKEIVQLLVRDSQQIHQNQIQKAFTTSTNNTCSSSNWELKKAYDRCLELAAKDASTHFLLTPTSHPVFIAALTFLIQTATFFWKSEQTGALAALVVWCRRTDELVDGINGCCTTLDVLDRWEQRLIHIFQSGHSCDMYDAALFDTIQQYPIHIQLFKDLIEGMRLDLRKTRYESFEELSLYCYHVAGSWAPMMIQLLILMEDGEEDAHSKQSLESLYNATLAFAFAGQLTDILQDIREDARMGRIYLPQDELANAGLSDEDIYNENVSDKWRNFMKGQINRARMYSDEGEKLVDMLRNSDVRWFF